MKLNEIYHGFKLINIEELQDINSTLYEFKHLKSGGHLAYIKNDDKNKCFSYSFVTLPEDSTGICHIIEHSLLCGSKKYPLKEPFVNLLKTSLSTFLNAFTANDITAYPVASLNDKDFFNLVSVYMDAVLNPLSIIDEKPFLQEGWHYELNNPNDDITIKGVVYNEMKGAMSDPESQVFDLANRTLYEGSPYGVNSGGDPEDIPNLTFDYYKEFYKKHYHPSNGLIYLYGDLDLDLYLSFFDQEYLSHYDLGEKLHVKPYEAKKNITIKKEYAISEDDTLEDNTYYAFSYKLTPSSNYLDLIALGILNQALFGSNDSYVTKYVLDKKLGKDLFVSLDNDMLIPNATIVLSKSNSGLIDEVEKAILEELGRLAKNGLNKKTIISNINQAEFKAREMDFGSMPKGLSFLFTLAQNFAYDLPLSQGLSFTETFNTLREKLEEGYFEDLIRKYYLDNEEYIRIELAPSKTVQKEKDDALKEKLKKYKASLSEKEIQNLIKLNEQLLAYQSKVDTKEELATLPKLELSDIKPGFELVKTKIENDGLKYFVHEESTNGIGYLDMYFNLKHFTLEELKYLVLYVKVLEELDTTHFKALELQDEIKTYLGDLRFSILSIEDFYTKAPSAYFTIKTSALKQNISHISRLANEVLFNTIFDIDKIKLVFEQIRNSYKDRIIGAGNQMASLAVKASLSQIGALNEEISGVTFYRFISNLLDNFDAEDIINKFTGLKNKIVNEKVLTSSVSGSPDIIEELKREIKLIKMVNYEPENNLHVEKINVDKSALAIPSMVNYNAYGLNINELGYKDSGTLRVLLHILRYDYLWPEIRVKGGAYGASVSVASNGDLWFSTYRDPNVLNSYNAFDSISAYLDALELDDFVTYIIGSLATMERAYSIQAAINIANGYLLGNLDLSYFANIKEEALKAKLEDVKALRDIFVSLENKAYKYAIGNCDKLEESKLFDKIENL